jgi:hypothetical protein
VWGACEVSELLEHARACLAYEARHRSTGQPCAAASVPQLSMTTAAGTFTHTTRCAAAAAGVNGASPIAGVNTATPAVASHASARSGEIRSRGMRGLVRVVMTWPGWRWHRAKRLRPSGVAEGRVGNMGEGETERGTERKAEVGA